MKIGIVGVGNMGYAFAEALKSIDIFSFENLMLFERNPKQIEKIKKSHLGIQFDTINEKISDCDVVLLGVKPQGFAATAENLSQYMNDNQIVISIMAGVSVEVMQNALPTKKIVRAMPNTPCQLGKGVTGYFMSDNISPERGRLIEMILNSTGSSVKVDKEDLVDSVTAVSGSGPAYFYYFLKYIVDAGVEMGLDKASAKELALKTMSGSGFLIESSETSFEDLIKEVKSKGGTTEAALNTLERDNVGSSIENALKNAKNRAKELSEIASK